MISPTEHFRNDGNGILLNGEGIRLFIREFNRKPDTRMIWEGQSVTYRQIIRQDIRNFRNYVNGEADYTPFLYRN